MNASPETIRKAAIVIASLDEASADKLLESMPEEVASQIRWMSIELDNIADEERQTVLNEFLRNSGRQAPMENRGVEMEFIYQQPDPLPTAETKVATPPPFAFLNDAPSEMLAPFFEQEHPQVTAMVMSYLKPERASVILRQLPARLAADVVHRITQLDEPAQEIVADIEARIKQIVSRQTLACERRRLGMEAAQAILKASTEDHAAQLVAELRDRGLQIPDQVAPNRIEAQPVLPPTSLGPQLPMFGRAKPEIKSDPILVPKVVPTIPKTNSQPVKPGSGPAKLPEPKFSFEFFTQLDDKTLAQVLQQTGPKVVLLALCGASPAVMKRISRGLGASDTKLLQQKIREMQPVLLSDIDHAKRKMCLAAEALLSGKLAPKSGQLQAAA
ncbi:hypothetical protein GC197_05870 [bacterium]|nr:hypothetical protein [bacterium]